MADAHGGRVRFLTARLAAGIRNVLLNIIIKLSTDSRTRDTVILEKQLKYPYRGEKKKKKNARVL